MVFYDINQNKDVLKNSYGVSKCIDSKMVIFNVLNVMMEHMNLPELSHFNIPVIIVKITIATLVVTIIHVQNVILHIL